MAGDDPGTNINSVVRFMGILLIGVIILANMNSGLSSQMALRSATLLFVNNPSDGDTIALGGHIFEFDTGDGVASGHISVDVGLTVVDTVDNLETVINGV